MEVGDWMKIGTYHTHYDPELMDLQREIKQAARSLFMVYSEFVTAGFSEGQALSLVKSLIGKEE